jgi:hypothetical protein
VPSVLVVKEPCPRIIGDEPDHVPTGTISKKCIPTMSIPYELVLSWVITCKVIVKVRALSHHPESMTMEVERVNSVEDLNLDDLSSHSCIK